MPTPCRNCKYLRQTTCRSMAALQAVRSDLQREWVVAISTGAFLSSFEIRRSTQIAGDGTRATTWTFPVSPRHSHSISLAMTLADQFTCPVGSMLTIRSCFSFGRRNGLYGGGSIPVLKQFQHKKCEPVISATY